MPLPCIHSIPIYPTYRPAHSCPPHHPHKHCCRYLYQEGKKLAARYKEEEKELAEQLKQLYGSDADLISVQRNPKTPLQRIAEYQREAAGRLKQIEELKAKYADNAYMQYALTNQVRRARGFREDSEG